MSSYSLLNILNQHGNMLSRTLRSCAPF